MMMRGRSLQREFNSLSVCVCVCVMRSMRIRSSSGDEAVHMSKKGALRLRRNHNSAFFIAFSSFNQYQTAFV